MLKTSEYFRIKEMFYRVESGMFTILPEEDWFAVRFKDISSSKEYVRGVILHRAETYEECVAWCDGYTSRMFYEGVLKK
jgi:hypothetical protein